MEQVATVSTYRTPLGLNLTYEQFAELYPDLAEHYDFFNEPPPANISDKDFERRYLASKLWRLNNLYTIIDKDGNPSIFKMNYGQHKVYAASRIHPRVIILKSRQQGISTLWLVSYFDDAVWCPFFNIGLMAQGTDEASTLLERTKFLWDCLPDHIKSYIGVSLVKDNAKAFELSNKSTIFIRVSFRSTTLQRLHVSEFGKIANTNPKRAKETKTGTLQALAKGNTGAIESTAEGRNMFKFMWDDATVAYHSGTMAPKDFYPVFLSWLDDPDCNEEVDQVADVEAAKYFEELQEKTGRVLTRTQRNFWIVQRRELGGDIFQEYPATPEEAFTAARDGSYYSRKFNESCVRAGQVKTDLYDPNLPVDVYFDLGVDDYAVLAFVQWYRGEWRIFREYFNEGYANSHYMEYIKDSGIEVRSLNFPHDIRVREQSVAKANGRAKSRYEIAQEWCKDNRVNWRLAVLPKGTIADGIEAVRRMIPNMWIDPSCTYLIDCLNNYSKKYDEKLQIWLPTPDHNVYSHGADLLRYLASSTVESAGSHKSKLMHEYREQRSGGYDV